ncbi:AAA family ATPase [Ancylobacter sp. WKF20]|uniref:bifunctional aminoglycoside phosphotransferase/ATP-binding protein n=1 Tax=Ancylobacter sp. WKF20 TaxID=3039801 RepID=UPI00243418AD|nr:bifunctional aminoglycoside phosphotransferase/ATP-binding protein [Ancylobacter sp. WKF20]WGD29204.1 AAA family ATPase [Ancylobacter sp. WKF20]
MSTPAVSPAHVVADQEPVFALLADPATHGLADTVSRIDTHGAAVFLAGHDVYKVKRAVRFPFMDLSTLDKRHAACARELEVNRATAPGLYLDLVPIRRDGAGLRLGGDKGTIVEWAVHMRRFDEHATLDRLPADALTPALIDALARAVHAAHERAPRHVEVDSAGELAKVASGIVAGLRESPDIFAPPRVAALATAFTDRLARLSPRLDRRARAGEVRRGHGDLHLRNIALINGAPVLFDALEFDEALATTDRLYDLAFLLMDLGQRGLTLPANRLLNRYLAAGGDAPPYDGLAALPLFLALRAGIRAQVTAAALALRDGPAKRAAEAEALAYLGHAETALAPRPARLVAVGGLSGTGKSTLATRLAPAIGPLPGAVHLRSDVERKRLAGVGELDRLPPDAYTREVTEAVYATLRERARAVLAAGHGVIVDAVHQRDDERAAIEDVAREAGAAFTGLWLEAPLDTLTARVEGRRGDASDATAAVMAQQAARDCGSVRWHRLSTAGGKEATLVEARRLLP